jgi:hypothetical protein
MQEEQLGHESDYSLPFHIKVKNGRSYASPLPICLHGMDTNTSTSLIINETKKSLLKIQSKAFRSADENMNMSKNLMINILCQILNVSCQLNYANVTFM